MRFPALGVILHAKRDRARSAEFFSRLTAKQRPTAASSSGACADFEVGEQKREGRREGRPRANWGFNPPGPRNHESQPRRGGAEPSNVAAPGRPPPPGRSVKKSERAPACRPRLSLLAETARPRTPLNAATASLWRGCAQAWPVGAFFEHCPSCVQPLPTGDFGGRRSSD
jgi:hypothetical protein